MNAAIWGTFTALFVTALSAWVTHVIWAISTLASHVIWAISTLASDKGATVGQMVIGALGTFIPPVGVIHGIMIWFGSGA